MSGNYLAVKRLSANRRVGERPAAKRRVGETPRRRIVHHPFKTTSAIYLI